MSASRFQIYKGHSIERQGAGFVAHYNQFKCWFPKEIAAKHYINLMIERHESQK